MKEKNSATTVIEPVAEVTLGGYTARLTKADLKVLWEIKSYALDSVPGIVSKYDELFLRLHATEGMDAGEALDAMQQFREFKYDYDLLKEIDVRRAS